MTDFIPDAQTLFIVVQGISSDNPGNIAAYGNRGIAKTQLGDYKAAISDHSKVIEIDSENAKAYHDRGFAKEKSGDTDAALIDYNRGLGIDPTHAQLYHKRAVLRSHYRDYIGAIQDYTNAIKYFEHYESEVLVVIHIAYIGRGLSKKNLGDVEGAICDYDMALELIQKDDFIKGIGIESPAYLHRGNAKNQLGDLKGACEDWKKAAELGDEDAAKLVEKHCQ